MTILEEFEKIKKDTDKLKRMIDDNEHEKTHSNCCDAKIIMGICASCKEHTVSQSEE
jgi:hypothetical protein